MTLTKEQKEELIELNKQAKEIHPDVNDYIINLVNTNYLLHGEKEEITEEEKQFRINMYEKEQKIYYTEKKYLSMK